MMNTKQESRPLLHGDPKVQAERSEDFYFRVLMFLLLR